MLALGRLTFGGSLVVENAVLACFLMNVHPVELTYNWQTCQMKGALFFKAQFSMANAPASATLQSLDSRKLAEPRTQALLLNAQRQRKTSTESVQENGIELGEDKRFNLAVI